MKGQSAESFQN